MLLTLPTDILQECIKYTMIPSSLSKSFHAELDKIKLYVKKTIRLYGLHHIYSMLDKHLEFYLVFIDIIRNIKSIHVPRTNEEKQVINERIIRIKNDPDRKERRIKHEDELNTIKLKYIDKFDQIDFKLSQLAPHLPKSKVHRTNHWGRIPFTNDHICITIYTAKAIRMLIISNPKLQQIFDKSPLMRIGIFNVEFIIQLVKFIDARFDNEEDIRKLFRIPYEIFQYEKLLLEKRFMLRMQQEPDQEDIIRNLCRQEQKFIDSDFKKKCELVIDTAYSVFRINKILERKEPRNPNTIYNRAKEYKAKYIMKKDNSNIGHNYITCDYITKQIEQDLKCGTILTEIIKKCRTRN